MTKQMSAKIVDYLIDLDFRIIFPFIFCTARDFDEIRFEISDRTINFSRDKKEMIRNIMIDVYNSGVEEGKKSIKEEFSNFVGLNEIRDAVQNLKYKIDDLKPDD